MNDLIPLENINPVDLYKTDDSVQKILNRITEAANSIVPDITTAKGRKDIASIAAKVARSKTYLDGLGKDLVADLKKEAKKTDDKRKLIRDSLDELKVHVRKPLTDYEEEQKQWAEERENKIAEIADKGTAAAENWMTAPIDQLIDDLDFILTLKLDEEWWGDYLEPARTAKDAAEKRVVDAIDQRKKYDADQAELARMRQDNEAREKADREEQIKREATDKARKEAEERERKAVQDKEAAERREKEAKANAKAQAEAAAKRERERIEQLERERQAAQKKREADIEHRREVNNRAVNDLMVCIETINPELAKDIVTTIAQGKVRGVEIKY